VKKPDILNTTFSTYTIIGAIGQGGNGYVYEAEESGSKVAIKILDPQRVTKEKLKRFENEYRFCSQDRHKNIIKVIDCGLTETGIPFFVMPLYTGSIRKIIGSLKEDENFSLLISLLDGIEASHRFNVVHRDLKPENILYKAKDIVIADYGIAEFGEDELYTAIETKDGSRLANFQYAAPEQRVRGGVVSFATDFYSLGLIANELFTGSLALGKDHATVGSVSEKYGYLDQIIDKMLQNDKNRRYQSVSDIKADISAKSREFISSLKISKLTNTVIPTHDIDDPVIAEPMRIVDVEWSNGTLTIQLNHNATSDWIWAINNMGGFTSVLGKGPEAFRFHGNKASIGASDSGEAQRIIDYFKQWLPRVATVYQNKLSQDAENAKRQQLEQLKRKVAEEEKHKTINASLKF
jgi:serine/threonine protein kinase